MKSLMFFTEDLLLKWMQEAVIWSGVQAEVLNDLGRVHDRATLASWWQMVLEWDRDHNCPDPYEEIEEGSSLHICDNSRLTCIEATELRDLETSIAEEDADNDAAAAAQGQPKSLFLSVKSFVKVGRDLQRRQ
jgi:hypothetical protein